MMTMLEPILGTLDTNVLLVFAIIIGFCLVLSLIKKAFKVAIFMTIFLAGAIVLMPIVKDFQQNYKITQEGGVMYITVEGVEYQISRQLCSDIFLENKGSKGYTLRATYREDNSVLNIMIPRYMTDQFIEFAERYKIDYTFRD